MSEQPRRDALQRVLKSTSHLTAKTTLYAAAIGASALIATGDPQRVIDLGVAGLGVEAMGTLLDRISSGEPLSEDDISEYVREAIRDSGIENALTRNELRADLAKVIRDTHLNLIYDTLDAGNRELAERLVEQSAQIDALRVALDDKLPDLYQRVQNFTVQGDVVTGIGNFGGTVTFQGDVTINMGGVAAGETLHRHFRVFLSSPGDVTTERAIVRGVIDGLNADPFMKQLKITLELVAWDSPGAGIPMQANLPPQESVNEAMPLPADCDIVLVIFWSRMGTMLPETICKPDGSRYLSGTEWEYRNALAGYERTGSRPKTLVYRREEKVLLDLDDSEFDEKRQQYQRVKDFFAGFYAEDGAIVRGYNGYDTTDQFRQDVERHLRAVAAKLVDEARQSRSTRPTLDATDMPADTPDWDDSPFPGLRAFTPADAPIFYGRGAETDVLARLVREHRFVAVVGASGSGKSSLVGAGLIPRLRDETDWHLPDYDTSWRGLRFTPGQAGDNPFTALAVRLNPDNPRTLSERLSTAPAELSGVVREYAPGETALLFIDQFEEVFTLVADRYRRPFMDMLVTASEADNLRVVVTVRADFLHRFIEFGRLNNMLKTGSFPLSVPRLGALYQMITRPAQRAGLSFEAGLAEQILDDTGTDPGGLALLAYALDELYKVVQAHGDGRLAFADYNALGGVQGAIGTRAEDTFKQLPGGVENKADLLARVFRDLVEVDERGTATRRRVIYAPDDLDDDVRRMIDAFTDARLLTTDVSRGTATLEVAHEALLREWERLSDWIADMQGDLYTLRELRKATAAWEANNRSRDFLWLGDRGQDAGAMIGRLNPDLNDAERAFARPEAEHLLDEIADIDTLHPRRSEISTRLHQLNYTLPGAGLRDDGLPDIVWCDVDVSEKLQGQPIAFEDHRGKVYGEFVIKPFLISKYLVTYEQFQAFVEHPNGFKNPEWWRDMPVKYRQQEVADARQPYTNYPRDSVSWYQAVAFGRWLSAEVGYEVRLPTEWEWQWAAQNGTEQREYPWEGGVWDGRRCNTDESGIGRSTAVGMYPPGVAECGALDMAGNLFEWCLNKHKDTNDTAVDDSNARRVLRGGSWYDDRSYARAAYRYYDAPNSRYSFLGFRLCCVRAPSL